MRTVCLRHGRVHLRCGRMRLSAREMRLAAREMRLAARERIIFPIHYPARVSEHSPVSEANPSRERSEQSPVREANNLPFASANTVYHAIPGSLRPMAWRRM